MTLTKHFKVLYGFACAERHADIGDCLRCLVSDWNASHPNLQVQLDLVELDTLRGGKDHNLLCEQLQDAIFAQIDSGEFDLVLMAPPCNTFSRAVFSRHPGPQPIRDHTWLLGFPNLGSVERARAEEGNSLAWFSLECLRRALRANSLHNGIPTQGWLEFPEDLGSSDKGTPASILQFPEACAFQGTRAIRGAIYQCEWADTHYSKPTGILTTVAPFFQHDLFFAGWPSFEELPGGHQEATIRTYVGPLPRRCKHGGHQGLIGRNEDGIFKTAPTGAYPPSLSKAFASLFWADFVVQALGSTSQSRSEKAPPTPPAKDPANSWIGQNVAPSAFHQPLLDWLSGYAGTLNKHSQGGPDSDHIGNCGRSPRIPYIGSSIDRVVHHAWLGKFTLGRVDW